MTPMHSTIFASANPLDWKGPEFLFFYITLILGGTILAALLRYRLRNPDGDAPAETNDLHPYEVAYLAGGGPQTACTVLSHLVHTGVLGLDSTNGKIEEVSPLPLDAHPLEFAAMTSLRFPYKGTIQEARQRIGERLDEIEPRLRQHGLIPSWGDALAARIFPTLIMLGVLAFGLLKIYIGASGGKPIGFLIFLCIVTFFIAAVGFGRRVVRSRRGDKFYQDLRAKQAALQTTAKANPDNMTAPDFSMAVALFGTTMLVTGPYSAMHTSFTPPSGSTCGGGGCGSGGGDGGGGCGGGGCGGCGG